MAIKEGIEIGDVREGIHMIKKTAKINEIRPVLLSAPYAYPKYAEVLVNLKSGMRTCGMVEITLEDGTKGLGEGYLAVFAPHVFCEIVKLIAPYLIGKDVMDINALYKDMCKVTDYWSYQGAARHVISALEIAMVDARAKYLNVPAYSLFGGKKVDSIKLYGSGGDSLTPEEMYNELKLLKSMGIEMFKIRAQNYEVAKTVWTMKKASEMGIRVAVDMCQNLSNPAQTVSDVVKYLEEVSKHTADRIEFLEEALGVADIESYPLLRQKAGTKICGGEIVTTASELCRRVEQKFYDFVQPDATVIGGIGQTLDVFSACLRNGSEAVVHCWGGAVCMMANYHTAFAGGGRLAEWPMPDFKIRQDLMIEPLRIINGELMAPELPGLGVILTPELEKKYAFREEAIYSCIEDLSGLPVGINWEV